MRFLLAAAFWAAFFAPVSAVALTLQCVPREQIFDSLRASHGEVPAYRGVTASGELFEVLVGPDGSFTVFFTFPDGLTCPVAAGEGWRDVPETSGDPAA
jgi:hypothetical protein